jgi:hypothetical protein
MGRVIEGQTWRGPWNTLHFSRELSQPTFDIGNTTFRAFEGVVAGVMAAIVIALVAVL